MGLFVELENDQSANHALQRPYEGCQLEVRFSGKVFSVRYPSRGAQRSGAETCAKR